MEELIAFLRARLDEDAAAARAATPGPWWYNPRKQWLEGEAFESYDLAKGLEFVGYGGPHPFTGAVAGTGPADHSQSMADAAHIARHDPARVLAEVDAKRRILDECAYWIEKINESTTTKHPYPNLAERGEVVLPVLTLLGLPYAEHPEYRTEWRP